MNKLGKLLTAMVTPFDRDLRVDYDRAAELAVKLLAEGNDGLVIAGSTGEASTLTDEEQLELMRVVKRAVGAAPVVGGSGTNDFAHTVELTRAAAQTGVDAVMLVGPYYNRPPQEGFYQHFSQAAAVTDLPVILYNIPGRTGKNIEADTILRLAENVPNIVGVKEGSGDLKQMSEICARRPADFTVWSGDDAFTLPLMALGGVGVISVVGHIAGPRMKRLIEAFDAGDTRAAAAEHYGLINLIEACFLSSGNPACIKRALEICGFPCGGLRLPLVGASEVDTAQIRRACEELGLA